MCGLRGLRRPLFVFYDACFENDSTALVLTLYVVSCCLLKTAVEDCTEELSSSASILGAIVLVSSGLALHLPGELEAVAVCPLAYVCGG